MQNFARNGPLVADFSMHISPIWIKKLKTKGLPSDLAFVFGQLLWTLLLASGFGPLSKGDSLTGLATHPSASECESQESSGARLQIYWRSLFGESELKPPFEVAFTLMNSNTTGTDTDDSDDGWMATMYEGWDLSYSHNGNCEKVK